MNYQKKLLNLEHKKLWDTAIKYLTNELDKERSNEDLYLSLNYLLMNILVEEEYTDEQHDRYATLLAHYFQEGMQKFSDSTSYNYYSAIIAAMSPWYVDLTQDDVTHMIQQAIEDDPDNSLYQNHLYADIDIGSQKQRKEAIACSKKIFSPKSSALQELSTKGALGEYIQKILVYWKKRTIDEAQIIENKELNTRLSYQIMIKFLQTCSNVIDIPVIKVIVKNIDMSDSLKPKMWLVWRNCTNDATSMSYREAYINMINFVEIYPWNIKTNELQLLLQKIEFNDKTKTSCEPKFWDLWLDVIKTSFFTK